MRVLTVNAGSSSLKLRLLGPNDEVERSTDAEPGVDLEEVLRAWPAPEAVGHRVVHGGTRFTEPIVIDTGVRKELEDLTALAPLHQPKSLAGLDAVTAQLPEVPAVACFDTAFHTTIPQAAATYAVPGEWRERYAIRRYGFHGLSHAWCSARVARFTGARRIVTAHLGAGASLAAVLDGRSVDTTMGFTPLEGLVMATRSGSVDPGLVLWLEEHEGLSPREVAETLEKRSGLAALAGKADMREVLAAAGRGDAGAVLALDVYVHRLAAGIASMAAAAGGIEALAFTGGVGEHTPEIRARAAERLAFLGLAVDPARNDTNEGEITAAGAAVRTLVVPAREDLEIARGTRAALR
ncbi:acetate/propionate family kinase [Pseudonocardia sp. RS11V-5]|uniref:acetate/propionate family kinase n=1 Tax=Pseudonocardia terrae TaxID=2905831 RepID=UPI001E41EA33|nr:acetate/propionate family kinase [Pseudonocardia terrae]MCE3553160.1 acetate/propionate family kinase [Pseudonocardia terrae]